MKRVMQLCLWTMGLFCLASVNAGETDRNKNQDPCDIHDALRDYSSVLEQHCEDAEEEAGDEAEDEPAGGDSNVVYKLVKGNLLDGSEGTPKAYDAKKLLNVKYYFLCFTTLEFPEYRDTLKLRVKHQYKFVQNDHPGKAEFIFIPTDKNPKHLAKYLPEMKLPFPILKRQAAEKSKLNSLRGSNNHFFAVVTADGKVVTGSKGPLKATSKPVRLMRDFMDYLEENE